MSHRSKHLGIVATVALAITLALGGLAWYRWEHRLDRAAHELAHWRRGQTSLVDDLISGRSGDSGRAHLLIDHGRASIPALRRELADPTVTDEMRVHLAWILATVGDPMGVDILVDRLGSPNEMVRYMAAFRLLDFPGLARERLPAILEKGMGPQHPRYWSLLEWIATAPGAAPELRGPLEKLARDHEFNQTPLTRDEIDRLPRATTLPAP